MVAQYHGFPGDPIVLASLRKMSLFHGYGTYLVSTHQYFFFNRCPLHSYVHGQRVVCPQARDASILQVLDFNVHPSQTSSFSILDKGTTRSTCIEPSTLPPNEIFQNQITTTLPYIVTARAVVEQYSAYMMDAERIIGLKVCAPRLFYSDRLIGCRLKE